MCKRREQEDECSLEDRGQQLLRSNHLQTTEEPHLVCKEEVFLHNAEASSDGQQLPLLLLLSGQIGEEDHLTVLDAVLPGVTLLDVFVRSLRSVGRAQIFLMVTQSGQSAWAHSPALQTSQLTSMTSRVLDR